MKQHFHREMEKLKQQLLALSAEVERAVEQTQQVVINLDIETARKVIAYDKTIDQHEVDIEEECLKMMALYQPVAADLRLVVAILKINNDLERMGDLARNISEYVLEIVKYGAIDVPARFKEMFVETLRMVQDALDALMRENPELAIQVCERDDIVDRLNVTIIREVQAQIEADPSRLRPLLYLISVSRSVERIADYATNISEDVVYMVRGVIVRHNTPDKQKKA